MDTYLSNGNAIILPVGHFYLTSYFEDFPSQKVFDVGFDFNPKEVIILKIETGQPAEFHILLRDSFRCHRIGEGFSKKELYPYLRDDGKKKYLCYLT